MLAQGTDRRTQLVAALPAAALTLGAAAFRILAICIAHADTGGMLRASAATLAKSANIDPATVRRGIEELRDSGHLQTVSAASGAVSVYRITTPGDAPDTTTDEPPTSGNNHAAPVIGQKLRPTQHPVYYRTSAKVGGGTFGEDNHPGACKNASARKTAHPTTDKTAQGMDQSACKTANAPAAPPSAPPPGPPSPLTPSQNQKPPASQQPRTGETWAAAAARAARSGRTLAEPTRAALTAAIGEQPANAIIDAHGIDAAREALRTVTRNEQPAAAEALAALAAGLAKALPTAAGKAETLERHGISAGKARELAALFPAVHITAALAAHAKGKDARPIGPAILCRAIEDNDGKTADPITAGKADRRADLSLAKATTAAAAQADESRRMLAELAERREQAQRHQAAVAALTPAQRAELVAIVRAKHPDLPGFNEFQTLCSPLTRDTAAEALPAVRDRARRVIPENA